MMGRIKRARSIAIVCILSCATPKPYQATFSDPLFENPEVPGVVKNDVVFQFEPITRENATRFSISLPITYADASSSRATSHGGERGVTASQAFQMATTRRSELYLLPLPAFAVQITNESTSPVTFAKARFELMDSTGRSFPIITDPLALQHEVETEMRTINMALSDDVNVKRALEESVRNVPLLDNRLEIPKAGKWVGFLAFRIRAYGPEEYYPLMRSIENLTLKISDVRAGAKSIEFSIPYYKKAKSVQVTCPAEVKEPSLERCQAG